MHSEEAGEAEHEHKTIQKDKTNKNHYKASRFVAPQIWGVCS